MYGFRKNLPLSFLRRLFRWVLCYLAALPRKFPCPVRCPRTTAFGGQSREAAGALAFCALRRECRGAPALE